MALRPLRQLGPQCCRPSEPVRPSETVKLILFQAWLGPQCARRCTRSAMALALLTAANDSSSAKRGERSLPSAARFRCPLSPARSCSGLASLAQVRIGPASGPRHALPIRVRLSFLLRAPLLPDPRSRLWRSHGPCWYGAWSQFAPLCPQLLAGASLATGLVAQGSCGCMPCPS